MLLGGSTDAASITIAASGLGAVLLLIAILHGSFKIFGAEIDGSAGRFGRFFAGLLGVILIGVGLFSSFYKSAPELTTASQKPASESSRVAEDASQSTATKQSQTEPAQPEQNVNIAGTWHDADGNLFQISQLGNKFTIHVTGMNYTASSSGTLHGHELERTYETLYDNKKRVSGHDSGIVSSDVSVIRATRFEANGGPWESLVR